MMSFLERDHLVAFYNISVSEVCPYKRGVFWWKWPYKRGGLWWKGPNKRGGLWWKGPNKSLRGGLWWKGPNKKGGLCWKWLYKRGGIWWKWPYKRGGLWWKWPYKKGGLYKRGLTRGGYCITIIMIKWHTNMALSSDPQVSFWFPLGHTMIQMRIHRSSVYI